MNAGLALPQIPAAQFPGVALANALYLEGGVRTVEIGSLMFSRPDPESGEMIYAPMELVRFAIPRRVYTRSHLEYVGECAAEMMKHIDAIKGLRVTRAPQVLRHFTAELEQI